MKQSIELTVIIPVYNSSKIFPELYSRINQALNSNQINFEVIAVVDGNKDGSSQVIENIADKDSRLKMLLLSRNFGQQVALTAGLEHSSGSFISFIDDDLEDPPEVIPHLLNKAKNGFDVVYGIRKKRKTSFLRKLMYFLFYRLLDKLTDISMPKDSGDFCVISARVAKSLLKMPERNRYLRGMRAWVGFNSTGVEYEREPRFDGESGFNLIGYFRFASDAIFSFSYKPLVFIAQFGLIVALATFLLGLWILISRLLTPNPEVPGFALIAISILFIGSIQLISLGILGQYIGRIYEEVKQRPMYIIQKKKGEFNLNKY